MSFRAGLVATGSPPPLSLLWARRWMRERTAMPQGKVLAYTCHGCHGVPDYRNAYPNYRVPKLGGQNEAYLVSALNAYAGGDRSHPTMHAQAATLTDQDRADIAAFLQAKRAVRQSGRRHAAAGHADLRGLPRRQRRQDRRPEYPMLAASPPITSCMR